MSRAIYFSLFLLIKLQKAVVYDTAGNNKHILNTLKPEKLTKKQQHMIIFFKVSTKFEGKGLLTTYPRIVYIY